MTQDTNITLEEIAMDHGFAGSDDLYCLRTLLADPAILAHIPEYATQVKALCEARVQLDTYEDSIAALREIVDARNAECADLDARCNELKAENARLEAASGSFGGQLARAQNHIADLIAENERYKQGYEHTCAAENSLHEQVVALQSQLADAIKQRDYWQGADQRKLDQLAALQAGE